MLKSFILTLGTAFGVSSAIFFAGPRLTYSGLQAKLPIGSGIKVVPDGTNIWTWHHEQLGNGQTEVVVDFDRNGRMDTEDPCVRVLITDMQVVMRWNPTHRESIVLRDDGGNLLWELHQPGQVAWNSSYSFHLATPLPVQAKSKLHRVVAGFHSSSRVQVRLIGRIVNL